MNNIQTISINTSTARCNGAEVPYDHPTVYLQIDPTTKEVTCPYCSKRFKFLGSL
jgi:uncharacterized Zn-finger protein